MKFAAKWMETESSILSEVTQTLKDRYAAFSYIRMLAIKSSTNRLQTI